MTDDAGCMESAICKSEPNEPDGKHLNSSDDPVTGGRYDRVGESWGGVVRGVTRSTFYVQNSSLLAYSRLVVSFILALPVTWVWVGLDADVVPASNDMFRRSSVFLSIAPQPLVTSLSTSLEMYTPPDTNECCR